MCIVKLNDIITGRTRNANTPNVQRRILKFDGGVGERDVAVAISDVAAKAIGLFNQMCDSGLSPNTRTYNAVMTVLARAADPKVFEMFNRMVEQARQRGELPSAVNTPATSRTTFLREQGVLLGYPRIGGGRGGSVSPDAISLDGTVSNPGSATIRRKSKQMVNFSPGVKSTGSLDDDTEADGSQTIRPDLITYNNLIIASEKLGLFEKALEFFHMMIDVGIKPDKATYMKMMDVCVLKEDTARARALFNEAKSRQILADVDLYNSLMNVLAQCRDPEIFQVFEEMVYAASIKPTHQSYNILLRACERNHDIERAYAIFEEMRRYSLEVDPVTAARNAAGISSEGAASTALVVATPASAAVAGGVPSPSKVLPGPPVSPATFSNKADWTETYNILMDVCAHNCDTERVRELLADMNRNGVVTTISTYNRIMTVFSRARDPGVVDFFNTIRRDGPTPNLETYVILLKYYCDRVDDTILSLFDDLKRSGSDPDVDVYNIMLLYCAKVQDKRKSLRFFEELKVRGLVASLNTYNALMAVFAESGDTLIYKVFEEMNENDIKPDPATYSILIKNKKSLECLRKAAEQDLLLPSLRDASASGKFGK